MATTVVEVGEAVEFYLGEERTLTFTVKDDAGSPLDLTGKDYKFQLRLSKYHPTVLIEKAAGNGLTVDPDQTANRGKVHVVFVETDTLGRSSPPTNLYPGEYAYGLAQLGVFDVQAAGPFVLLGSAVRP